jgi:hypothetical protein
MLLFCGSDADAQQYVWTRTAWGSSNVNARYGSMSNGYGGYYAPVNGYGNNYESQGNFTNPNGYIVPANAGYVQQTSQPTFFQRHRSRNR